MVHTFFVNEAFVFLTMTGDFSNGACKFVCFSDKDQSETPDAEEQKDLLLADLVEVKITVHSNLAALGTSP